MKLRRRGLGTALVVLALLLAGCVTFPADFKEPTVSLLSIRPDISNVFAPEFDLRLRVSNPNRDPLEIVGLSYNISLQGRRLIEGVASELPVVPAYGEADFGLRATADLVGGFNLLAELMDRPGEDVDFELNADIDLGRFYPMVKVRRSGSISLQ
jgi:LEA14-like dessication related protein